MTSYRKVCISYKLRLLAVSLTIQGLIAALMHRIKQLIFLAK